MPLYALALKRIRLELEGDDKYGRNEESRERFIVCFVDNDPFHWAVSFRGPPGSCYEDGIFNIYIWLPSDYPFSPPRGCLLTQIYHCNFSATGAFSMDTWKEKWSPALTVLKLVQVIWDCLADPNPDNPSVPDIARQFREDRASHDRCAREWVHKYALGALPEPQSLAVFFNATVLMINVSSQDGEAAVLECTDLSGEVMAHIEVLNCQNVQQLRVLIADQVHICRGCLSLVAFEAKLQDEELLANVFPVLVARADAAATV